MDIISYKNFKTWIRGGFLLSLFIGLVGCSALDGAPYGAAGDTPDAIPKAEPRSKSANPSSYVVAGKRYYVMKDTKGYDKVGKASWYGTKFHGRRTSSDEPYNMYGMTGASTVLPIPSYVRVTNLANGRTAVVRINDHGPFRSNRIIDLSYAAAKKLGYIGQGTANVRVTAIDVSSSSNTLFAQNDAVSEVKQIKSKSIKPIHLAKNNTPVYLQVGTFHTRHGAESMSQQISKLTKLNHTQVAIKEGTSSGSRVYRVHVGPLRDASKSEEMARLLAKNGFNKTVVIAG